MSFFSRYAVKNHCGDAFRNLSSNFDKDFLEIFVFFLFTHFLEYLRGLFEEFLRMFIQGLPLGFLPKLLLRFYFFYPKFPRKHLQNLLRRISQNFCQDSQRNPSENCSRCFSSILLKNLKIPAEISLQMLSEFLLQYFKGFFPMIFPMNP